jgi:hypothetical protein
MPKEIKNMLNGFRLFYDEGAAGGGTSGGTGGGAGGAAGGTPNPDEFADFQEFLAKQPENIRKLYDTDVQGLKNTVAATRQERDDFAAQVKELAKSAGKDTELQTKLNDMSAKIEAANRKADFMEQAPAMECKNAKAAYALMLADNLFDRKGQPDWAALKQAAPELFGKRTAKTNAGEGAGDPPVSGSMNDWIRQQARGH